jgi:hypothetical protein
VCLVLDSNEYAIFVSRLRALNSSNPSRKNWIFGISFSKRGFNGGSLLGVRSNTFTCFYDWDSGEVKVA